MKLNISTLILPIELNLCFTNDTPCYLNILTDWRKVEELYGDNRPLDDKQRRVIDANRHVMVKLIDPECGIIDRLYENKCFNFLHKNHTESGTDKLDKVDRLLDIVRRQSVVDFKKLINALDTVGYPRLAQVLREGKGKSTKYNVLPIT